jgi:hypothetical protein
LNLRAPCRHRVLRPRRRDRHWCYDVATEIVYAYTNSPVGRGSSKNCNGRCQRDHHRRSRRDARIAHAALCTLDAAKPRPRRRCGIARIHGHGKIPAGSFLQMELDFFVELTLE